MNKLTTEQTIALIEWSKFCGRTWKSELRIAWMNGDYQGFANSGPLQQIRNTFGPSWLVNLKLDKIA